MARRISLTKWSTTIVMAGALALSACTAPSAPGSDAPSQPQQSVEASGSSSPSATKAPVSVPDGLEIHPGFEPAAEVLAGLGDSSSSIASGMAAMVSGKYVSPSARYSVADTNIQAALPTALAGSCTNGDVLTGLGSLNTESTKTVNCESGGISFSATELGEFDQNDFAEGSDGNPMDVAEGLEQSCLSSNGNGTTKNRFKEPSSASAPGVGDGTDLRLLSVKCFFQDEHGEDRTELLFASYAKHPDRTTTGLYMGAYGMPAHEFEDNLADAMWAGATTGTATPLFLGIVHAMNGGAGAPDDPATVPTRSPEATVTAPPETEAPPEAQSVDAKWVQWASSISSSADTVATEIDGLGCETPGDTWSVDCLNLLEGMPAAMDEATAGITLSYEEYGTPETESLNTAATSARSASSYSYGISQRATEAGCLSQNTPQREIARSSDGQLVPCYMFFTTSYWHQYAENLRAVASPTG